MVRTLSEINLIHKSDVYFDVLDPMIVDDDLNTQHRKPRTLLHRGEIYIYQNKIFLSDGVRWYKANIKDIKEIKSNSNQKQILIHFLDFDLVLSCEEYSHLLALRDYLFLAQKNYVIDNNLMLKEAK
jgi:hypothetical protein